MASEGAGLRVQAEWVEVKYKLTELGEELGGARIHLGAELTGGGALGRGLGVASFRGGTSMGSGLPEAWPIWRKGRAGRTWSNNRFKVKGGAKTKAGPVRRQGKSGRGRAECRRRSKSGAGLVQE